MTYKHITYETAACRAARQDCIDRQGDCSGCPHAVPSLGNTCMIRQTAQVVAALGGEALAAKFGIGLTCLECGEDFLAMLNSARYCEPCRSKRKLEAQRKRRQTLTNPNAYPPRCCDICQASYQPLNSLQRYCHGCKDQDLRVYKCGACGSDYVTAGRQKYTRRCEGCKTARKQSA